MIHQFKFDDKNIVLDTYSGSVHLVDDMAYDVISMFADRTREEIISALGDRYADRGVAKEDIAECIDQVAQLKEQGLLFADDTFKDMAHVLKDRTRGRIKALCLHVAHTCNLNCAYCFASQGKYHGERALMSLDTAKRALDFLILNSDGRHNLEVDFFGGEPLMNFGMLKDLVAYARSIEAEHDKHFRFTLTTNGMLIDDEVIEWANREMSNVVLSLDGRREVHDRYRVDYKGRGSWDKVVPLFQKFVSARGDGSYYIRGTYTHHNTDFLNDIKAMLDLGFDKLSMEPVVCSPDDPCALTEEDMPLLEEQYRQLARLMIERKRTGRPFTFYHYMLDLKDGPCIYKRLSGCGSGTEYMAVTPWGDLYPCHQFVGDEKFKIGNIYDGVQNAALTDEFASCNVYSRPQCRDCWAKLYCSGGCAANAYHATGSISGVYDYGCRLFRTRMECAIAVAAEDLEDTEADD